MKNIISKDNRAIINVDKYNYTPIAQIKQSDDCVLYLTVYKNSVPLDISGQTISLRVRRPDGTLQEMHNSDSITYFKINKSDIDIACRNSIFAIAGKTELELNIKDVEGQFTTATFYIQVDQKAVTDNAVKATNEFDVFDEATKRVEQMEIQGISDEAITSKIQEMADEGKLDGIITSSSGIDKDTAVDYITLSASDDSTVKYHIRIKADGTLIYYKLDQNGREIIPGGDESSGGGEGGGGTTPVTPTAIEAEVISGTILEDGTLYENDRRAVTDTFIPVTFDSNNQITFSFTNSNNYLVALRFFNANKEALQPINLSPYSNTNAWLVYPTDAYSNGWIQNNCTITKNAAITDTVVYCKIIFKTEGDTQIAARNLNGNIYTINDADVKLKNTDAESEDNSGEVTPIIAATDAYISLIDKDSITLVDKNNAVLEAIGLGVAGQEPSDDDSAK